METVLLIMPEWLEPTNLLAFGGLTLLLLVVFIENSFFFGFFLPGDSLLFTAGLFCGSVYLPVSLLTLIGALILTASLGSLLGYWFGKKFGFWIKNLPDGKIYKRKHLEMTSEYYEKKGSYAFIMGRFLPVIRTFVPILAGIVNMPFKKFMLFNVLGVSIWVIIIVTAGFFLGKTFPQLIHHLEWVILALVVLPLIPVLKKIFSKNAVKPA
ncbi:DedA family protein [Marivirga sp.]|uniref:DedA family protein n=1 Tax=Marivirga sp. TaxID=2018662 RepID=UPI002D7F58E6|nr:DedA family protein [Marivirga sp.]HET8860884.1 DedA family protein [Marivirga sp.]